MTPEQVDLASHPFVWASEYPSIRPARRGSCCLDLCYFIAVRPALHQHAAPLAFVDTGSPEVAHARPHSPRSDRKLPALRS